MVQELSELHKIGDCFQETVAWCDFAIKQPNPIIGLAGKDFFEFLRDRSAHNMDQQWRLIETTAHKQGAPLRQFAFTDPGQLLNLSDEVFQAEMENVASARRKALSEASIKIEKGEGARGALVYFEPWLSMYDGAAMMGSGGYFDVENFPPADTWVAYVPKSSGRRHLSGFLLAWVPDSIVEVAERGLRLDPSGSIRWAHEETSDMVQDICRQLQQTCPIR